MAFGDAMNDREMLGSVVADLLWAMRCRNCARSSRISGDWTLPKSGCLSLFDALAGYPHLPYSPE